MTSIEKQLAEVGYELYASHLQGTLPPSMQRRWERMCNPQLGDLVLQTHFLDRNLRSEAPFRNLGWLERMATERAGEAADGDPIIETVAYVALTDGSVDRWVNANVITILPAEGWKAARVNVQ